MHTAVPGGWTPAEQDEIWTRWRRGESLRAIGRHFAPGDCRACTLRARCVRAPRAGRQLLLHLEAEHTALAAARAWHASPAGRREYALRSGVEATMSQAVRACGARRARYRGLAKVHLQHVAMAAALNVARLDAWLAGRPLAPTRVSRFARLAA
jgi:hypothetical protein